MTGGRDTHEPVGDIVERLVADGRAAIDAEIGVWRAIVAWRVSGLKAGIPMLLGALFLAQAAATALVVGLIFVLAPRIGAGWATLVVIGGTLLLIALLAWAGVKRCRSLFAPLPETDR